MATSSPFSFLGKLLDRVGNSLQPPAWAVEEFHRRLVLLLNHVLMQEEQAMERLLRHQGRAVRFQWRHFTLFLKATPAGLLDLADALTPADLTLTVTEDSWPRWPRHCCAVTSPASASRAMCSWRPT